MLRRLCVFRMWNKLPPIVFEGATPEAPRAVDTAATINASTRSAASFGLLPIADWTVERLCGIDESKGDAPIEERNLRLLIRIPHLRSALEDIPSDLRLSLETAAAGDRRTIVLQHLSEVQRERVAAAERRVARAKKARKILIMAVKRAEAKKQTKGVVARPEPRAERAPETVPKTLPARSTLQCTSKKLRRSERIIRRTF